MISLHEQPGSGPEQDPAPDTAQKSSITDTSNQFMVGARNNGARIVVVRLNAIMTKAEAINLAAWLVVLADPTAEEFDRVVLQILKK